MRDTFYRLIQNIRSKNVEHKSMENIIYIVIITTNGEEMYAIIHNIKSKTHHVIKETNIDKIKKIQMNNKVGKLKR